MFRGVRFSVKTSRIYPDLMSFLPLSWGIIAMSWLFSHGLSAMNEDSLASRHPVFQVDYPFPTADKPQSKLWYMDGCWWALLPSSSGPSLWQRAASGKWSEHPEIAQKLKGLPGRADVWPQKDGITAVGVADNRLSVFRLSRKKRGTDDWTCEVLADLRHPGTDQPIETATIVQDTKGAWWVAATVGTSVWIWSSPSGSKKWTEPILLAQGIDEDDICTITRLPDGSIGVIWSDQISEAVVMRRHTNVSPAHQWEKEEIIEQGNNTADDHLNASLSSDGTLWVATKNSLDKTGSPQFVMRVRNRKGEWTNKPYVDLIDRKKPSRPIVTTVQNSRLVLSGYGDNDRSIPYPHNSAIIFGRIDTTSAKNFIAPAVVISPDSSYRSFVQNVTASKFPFPADAPWIVLASDTDGRVYEADLRKFFD